MRFSAAESWLCKSGIKGSLSSLLGLQIGILWAKRLFYSSMFSLGFIIILFAAICGNCAPIKARDIDVNSLDTGNKFPAIGIIGIVLGMSSSSNTSSHSISKV